MAGISFGDEADRVWIVAGWAFRQVLQDLIPYAEGERPFLDALTDAENIGFLDVPTLAGNGLSAKVTKAIETMCREVLDGSYRSGIEAAFLDSETQDAYREGIRMLLSAVATPRGPGPASGRESI